MSNEQIILFGPKEGKSLKRLYPEIAEEPVFKGLPDEDILFVWYYKNPSSPIDPELADNLRAQAAAARAFPSNPDKRKKFSALSFDDKIKLANERMSKYKPEARAMANRIVQNNFNNLLKMSSASVDSFKAKTEKGEEVIDWDAWNKYTTSVARTSEILPTLLKQVEEGFGVDVVKTETPGAFGGKKAINVFLDQHNPDD